VSLGTGVDPSFEGDGEGVECWLPPSAFPLLDETTTVLFQALEREGRTWETFSDHAMRHGSEVRAAARFMGYLPYFADLPVDELLDLRGRLHNPLVRFRGATTGISRDFESRPIDDTFETEVSDA
jgi:transposase InsO family protein